MKRLLLLLTILSVCGCINDTGSNQPQIIKSELGIHGFIPNQFNITINTPIVWKLNVLSLNACTDKVIIDGIGEFNVKEGDNNISFIPTKTDEIKFTCGMNMFRGRFNVK